MAELDTKKRRSLPDSKFALPKERKYPIPDAAHARNALARAAQDASPAQRKEIERRVHELFPRIAVHGLGKNK